MGGRRGPRRHPRTRHPRACPSAGRRGGARASPPRSSSLLRSRSRRAARWLDRDASSAGTGRAIDRTRRPPAATSSSATPRDRSAETRETWWGRFGRVRPGMPVPRALSRAWSSDLYIFARSSWLKERRNWWLKSVAISLFVATASQKKRVLEKKSIGASRERPRRFRSRSGARRRRSSRRNHRRRVSKKRASFLPVVSCTKSSRAFLSSHRRIVSSSREKSFFRTSVHAS